MSLIYPSQNYHYGMLRRRNRKMAAIILREKKKQQLINSRVKQQSTELKYGHQGALSLTFKSYGRLRTWNALR